MNLRKLKDFFKKFLHTPIHPQWLCAHNNKNIENINILNWVLSRISPADDMMPSSCQMVWKKKSSCNNNNQIQVGQQNIMTLFKL